MPDGGPPEGGASLRGCDRPLAEAFDVALLDLDGVVYVGGQPVAAAAEAVAAARQRGMRFAFVTNNASRSPEQVAAVLRRQGVEAQPPDVVTSGQAAVRLLTDRLPPRAPVLVVGTAALAAEVVAAGLSVADGAQQAAAVVQGYDPTLGYARLAEAALAVRRGVPWVATNTDATIPTPRGLLPGNGALVAVVRTATGRDPVVAGKPGLPLHQEAVGRTGALRPLVVGDRLDTDVLGAQRAGTPSLLVLTGVTTVADLLDAPASMRPTFLGRDLCALLSAQPTVHADDRSVRCGGWEARVRDDTLHLAASAPDAEPLDALRAGCVAVWSAHDRGVAVQVPADAIPSLDGRR